MSEEAERAPAAGPRPSRLERALGQAAALSLAAAVVVLIGAEPRDDAGTAVVRIVLGLCLIIPSVCASLLVALPRLRAKQGSPPPRRARATTRSAGANLLGQVTLVGLLAIAHERGLWTAASVRLETPLPWPICGLAGAGVLLVLYGVAAPLYRAAGVSLTAESFAVVRSMWPRSRMGKAAVWLTLLLNPFTEELLHRGFVVCALAVLVGPVPAVLLGLVLCLLMHLYQGSASLPFHAAFYAAAVALLFSPLGLVGAIGCHLAGDLLPLLTMREGMDQTLVRRKVDHLRKLLAAPSAGPRQPLE